MERNLENKTAIVTGAARNIGYEIANHMLKHKAKLVIILDVLEKEGNKACKALNEKYGDKKAVFYKCDLTKDIDATYDKIIKNHKYVDVLVNNAGLVDEFQLRKAIEVNVISTMEMTYKYYAMMRKDQGGKGGTIINISSIGAFITIPIIEVYSGSKAAVLVFTKNLGHEINYNRTGVRVVAVCPGTTVSDMNPSESDIQSVENSDFIKDWLNNAPLQEPKVVAEATVQTFEKADSGTAWVIEGGAPVFQLKQEYNTK